MKAVEVRPEAAASPLAPIPPEFPRELRLVLALIRCAIGTGDASEVRALAEHSDPRIVGPLIRRHRVGAFLHHRLPAAALQALPDEVRGELSLLAERAMQRALLRAAELARLAQALEESGIAVASVKGPVLALQLYGGLGERHSGDLDLVVAPADVGRADALLRARGYDRTEPDFDLTARQQREHLLCHRENKYLGAASGIRLELKWRLFGSAGAAEPQRAWLEVAGRRVATLAPVPNALYLFCHGARHGWFRLFWLVDAALLLRDGRLDWGAVASEAPRMGARRSLVQGALLAHRLLGVAPPPEVSGLARGDRALARLEAHAGLRISGEAHTGPDPAEPIPYVMLLQERWADRFAILRSRLMYARNWRILPLPDPLFTLHYAAAPALWAYRRIARRSGPAA